MRACVNCGRTHRPSLHCCMECRGSRGVEHSPVCDLTWTMERDKPATAPLPPESRG